MISDSFKQVILKLCVYKLYIYIYFSSYNVWMHVRYPALISPKPGWLQFRTLLAADFQQIISLQIIYIYIYREREIYHTTWESTGNTCPHQPLTRVITQFETVVAADYAQIICLQIIYLYAATRYLNMFCWRPQIVFFSMFLSQYVWAFLLFFMSGSRYVWVIYKKKKNETVYKSPMQ